MQQAQGHSTSRPNRQNGRENYCDGEHSDNVANHDRGSALNGKGRERQEQLNAHGPESPQHPNQERLEVGPHPVPTLRPGQLVYHVHD
jgi:hypothetical protein